MVGPDIDQLDYNYKYCGYVSWPDKNGVINVRYFNGRLDDWTTD